MFWRKVAVAWSVVGVVGCVAEGALSFVPTVAALPGSVTIGLFLGQFPVFGSAVIGLTLQRRGVARDDSKPRGVRFMSPLPFAVPWWIGVVVALAGVCFVSAMSGLPGQPEVIHGSYVFVDHGSLIPTTVAGYRSGLRAQERIFSGIPAVFYAVSYGIHRHLGWPDDGAAGDRPPPLPLPGPSLGSPASGGQVGSDGPSPAQLARRFAAVEAESARLRENLRTTPRSETPPRVSLLSEN